MGGTIPQLASGVDPIPYTSTFDRVDRLPSENAVRLRTFTLQGRVRLHKQTPAGSLTEISSSVSSTILKSNVGFAKGQRIVTGTTDIAGTNDVLLFVVTSQVTL